MDTNAPRPDHTPDHPASGSHAHPAAEHGDRGGSPARAAVLAALAAHPGATVVDLADHTGLGRSTVAKALAALDADGLAARTVGGRRDGRRLPDTWTPIEPASADGGEPDDHPDTGDPGDHPAGSDGASADTAGGAYSADPTDGDRDDADSGEPPPPARDTRARLAPGQLRTKVAAHLRAHPHAELSPYQISRALGGYSAGAVANALDKLVRTGDAALASEKPRRYTAPNR